MGVRLKFPLKISKKNKKKDLTRFSSKISIKYLTSCNIFPFTPKNPKKPEKTQKNPKKPEKIPKNPKKPQKKCKKPKKRPKKPEKYLKNSKKRKIAIFCAARLWRGGSHERPAMSTKK